MPAYTSNLCHLLIQICQLILQTTTHDILRVVAEPATPRHMSRLLWLLPSGPDQIHKLSLRGNQQGHHNVSHALSILSSGNQGEFKNRHDKRFV